MQLNTGLILLPKDFDTLDFKNYCRQVIHSVDLSVARTKEKIPLSGGFFGVLELTSGASLTVSFNDPHSAGITFDSEQQVEIAYNQIYITNIAQAGATVKLYAGINARYMPYYRTKAILPTVTTQVHGKVSVLVTATQIVAAVGLRRQLVIHNNDAGNLIYVGSSTVTLPAGATPGIPIYPGQERVFATQPFFTGAIYGIADGATCQVLYWYCTE